MSQKTQPKPDEARRRFLKNCGKFAVVTPPIVSLMLSTNSRDAYAVPSSNHVDNGFGTGGGDGVPGNSNIPDINR
jgi:hypothetical protein